MTTIWSKDEVDYIDNNLFVTHDIIWRTLRADKVVFEYREDGETKSAEVDKIKLREIQELASKAFDIFREIQNEMRTSILE